MARRLVCVLVCGFEAVFLIGAAWATPMPAASAKSGGSIDLSGVRAIASGFEHSLALLSNGTVVAWGSNRMSQLGNGTTADANVPVEVCAAGVRACPAGSPASSYLHGVSAIAAGAFFSLAIVGGKVFVWGRAGDGSQGSLGIGRTRGNACNGECQTVPVAVCAVGVSACLPGSPPSAFLQGVTKVAAGTFFALAVLKDTSVVAWGSNTSGQLGNPSVTDRSVQPIAVCAAGVKACPAGSDPSKFLRGVSAVSGGDSFSMALQGHTVLAWGHNRYGQLGEASVSGPQRCSHFACSQVPLAVTRLKQPASAISAANYHSLAIIDNAHGVPIGVDAWGNDTEGQAGVTSKHGNACHGDCQTVPIAVHGNWNGLTAISGGRSFSLALVGGFVLAWGDNHAPGRLGNGGHKATATPVRVCAVNVKSCPTHSPKTKFLHNVNAISAGGTVSLALVNGHVLVWGSNYRGALGAGNVNAPGTAYPIYVRKVGAPSTP